MNRTFYFIVIPIILVLMAFSIYNTYTFRELKKENDIILSNNNQELKSKLSNLTNSYNALTEEKKDSIERLKRWQEDNEIVIKHLK